MELTKEFTEAVAENKKVRVRIMLKNIMLVDPSLNSFNEMLKYAENNMEELYDEHDDETLDSNIENWTEDYMNRLMVEVVNNFSKERIELLKKIVTYMYANSESDSNMNEQNVKEKNTLRNTQKIGIGVMVVGGATVIGGICASSIPVAIGGGIIVGVGIALFATSN